MNFTAGSTVGPYEIVEKRGQGAMATVYRAYHAALDRYVAMKVLHPVFRDDDSFIRRFQREAKVVAKLEHPNIVPVYDYAEHEGHPYLVLRYIEGQTLKERLQDGRPPEQELARIMSAVAAGLDYAHSQGVLHRDIKPSNILLTGDGGVFITDFGLARMTQAGESTLSQDLIMGTPHYISPEQARGDVELDGRADLYSLGVILYELATGEVPFRAESNYSVIHQHIFERPPSPLEKNQTLSLSMEDLLYKALAKEPGDRFDTAQELVGAFAKALEADSLATPDARISATMVPPLVEPDSGLMPLPDLEGLPPAVAPDQRLDRSRPSPTTQVAGKGQPRARPLLPMAGGVIIGMILCGGLFFALVALQRARNQREDSETPSSMPASLGSATDAALPSSTTLSAGNSLAAGSTEPTRDALTDRPVDLPSLDQIRTVEELLPLAQASPEDNLLKIELALAYFREGQVADARALLQTAIKETRSPQPARLTAERLLEQGHFDLAALILEAGLTRFPGETALQHLLVMSLVLGESEPLAVRRALGRVSEDPPGNITLAIGNAYLNYQSGNPTAALDLLDESLRTSPNPYRAELLFLRGRLVLEIGNTVEARQTLQQSLRATSTDSWLVPLVERALDGMDR